MLVMLGKPSRSFVVLLLAFLCYSTCCFAREGAFILVSRRLLSEDLVEGTPFNVTYEVHNVGKRYSSYVAR